uniref:F-BAR domain only protein 2 n=1 Tax=Sphaerodactylus townsendi TaxID=933632 RepID=A0ACB8EQ00_9SAUR
MFKRSNCLIFHVLKGLIEFEECNTASAVEGIKPRRRKPFGLPGIIKKEKDTESVECPDADSVAQMNRNSSSEELTKLKFSVSSNEKGTSDLWAWDPLVRNSGDSSSLTSTMSSSSSARPTTPLSLGALVPPPRPASRPKLPTGKLSGINEIPRPFSPPLTSNSSPPPPAPLARAESSSSISSSASLSAANTPTVGVSRGPSPVSLGNQDTLPVAVALTESVNAYFKGADPTKCIVKITGDMTVSFPSGIIKVFTSNPSPAVLCFRVSSNGIQSTPLNLATYWKCNASTTDVRVDYKYNPASMVVPSTLSNIQVMVPIDGGVTNMQSLPPAKWNAEQMKAFWKLSAVSEKSENGGSGSLRAKFDISEGPSKPTTLAVQFISEGSTLSGVDIELVGTGYRLSLVKKRFATGRYMADC